LSREQFVDAVKDARENMTHFKVTQKVLLTVQRGIFHAVFLTTFV